MEWSAIRVQVTGVASFFGLVCCRESAGPRSPIHYGASFIVPRSKRFDLRDHDAVVRLYEEARPPIVIHLKVTVEGIGANRLNPGRFFDDNAMGVQPIECARRFNVQKFVAVGNECTLWTGKENAPSSAAGINRVVASTPGEQDNGLVLKRSVDCAKELANP